MRRPLLFPVSFALLMCSFSSLMGAQLPSGDGYLPAATSSSASSINATAANAKTSNAASAVPEDASTLTRSAPQGHTSVAAGKQDDSSRPLPFPYQQGASPSSNFPYPSTNQQQQQQASPFVQTSSSPQGNAAYPGSSQPQQQQQSVPSGGYQGGPTVGPPPQGSGYPPQDPLRGLAYLEYIAYLLQTYPQQTQQGPPSCKYGGCDLSQFKQCTCVSPALYSPDGRGNCNVGVTKADTQVWCYVSEKAGHAQDLCPDARESSSRPGYYWSRIACITE